MNAKYLIWKSQPRTFCFMKSIAVLVWKYSYLNSTSLLTGVSFSVAVCICKAGKGTICMSVKIARKIWVLWAKPQKFPILKKIDSNTLSVSPILFMQCKHSHPWKSWDDCSDCTLTARCSRAPAFLIIQGLLYLAGLKSYFLTYILWPLLCNYILQLRFAKEQEVKK